MILSLWLKMFTQIQKNINTKQNKNEQFYKVTS